MRSISVLVGLCSLVAFAEEPFEIFVDRGETYVRAGATNGLELGASVTIWGDLIPTTKERRRAGTASVMEIWPSLARISLDEAARADKAAKKFATFEARGRPQQLPTPVPPPVIAAPLPQPVPSEPDAGRPAAKPGSAPILRGHATFRGAGPWMVLKLWNDEPFDWTKCTLTLPGNLVYTLTSLRGGDHESIALSNFVQQGPERDLPKESVTVRCTQGASKFLFPPD